MTITSTREFLNTVITAPEGYFLIAVGGNGHGWNEHFFEWPNQLDNALDLAAHYAPETNVYFSSYLFSDKRSLKDNVVPSRTIQADLDEADPITLPLQPTVLVQTSSGRYQGYWLLNETPLSLEAHEILSRKLTYSIPLCDHSGWPLGRKVRLPNTLNHKYLEGPQGIRISQASLRVYRESDLELLPDVSIVELEQYSDEFLENPPVELPEENIGAYELLESIKSRLPETVHQYMSTKQKDRSTALWHLMCCLFRAGLDRDKVFYLARRSANNKFADLRFHADRELAKDVLRAQQAVLLPQNIRDKIMEVRNARGNTAQKRQFIFGLVRDQMREEGEFLRAHDDPWYVRRDLGKPIPLSVRAHDLHNMLDINFGLNHVEIEHDYVLNSIVAFGMSLPPNAIATSLSHFVPELNSILLHTGKKDVLKITANEIERTVDGSYGIVFVWSISGEPFNPILDGPGVDWAKIMFGNCLDNVVGIPKEQAFAILKTWFLFLLFRSTAVSRPILALLGQPGSGKSTLFRRVYSLLYGKQRALDTVTSPENFDQAVAQDPLVVLDNVDTWAHWLPDRLAQAASTSDILKRKLYYDRDTIILKRQAMVGLTAHNPRFGREDIADRLLILNFERLSHFLPEGDIINTILKMRNHIWGAIVKDLQTVLQTKEPSFEESPQFRIEDYARIGLWIAKALNFESDFVAAINTLKTTATSFLMEEDSILVDTMQRFVEKSKYADTFLSASSLWNELQNYATESDRAAFDKIYKNAVFLGKKLWAMHTALKENFDMEWRFNSDTGARQWRLAKKSD